MKKQKLIVGFIIFAVMVLIATMVKAATSSIEIQKIVNSLDGKMTFKLSNIELNVDETYKWQLTDNTTNTEWYDFKEESIENKTATIELAIDKNDVLAILKRSDEAYLNIKEDNTTIVENLKIDISLPLSKAFKVDHNNNGFHGIENVYGIPYDKISYQYVKVTSKQIINEYVARYEEYKANNSSLYWGYYVDEVIETTTAMPKMPTDGWISLQKKVTHTQPTSNGLWFIWMKAEGDGKTIYGCVFSNRGGVTAVQKEAELLSDDLSAEVTYSKKDDKIVAKITANREINSIEGWGLSDDEKSLTKEYTKNTEEIVKVTDKYENTLDLKIAINSFGDGKSITTKTNSTKDNTMVTGILPKTGKAFVLVGILGILVIIASVMYLKNREYKDIK